MSTPYFIYPFPVNRRLHHVQSLAVISCSAPKHILLCLCVTFRWGGGGDCIAGEHVVGVQVWNASKLLSRVLSTSSLVDLKISVGYFSHLQWVWSCFTVLAKFFKFFPTCNSSVKQCQGPIWSVTILAKLMWITRSRLLNLGLICKQSSLIFYKTKVDYREIFPWYLYGHQIPVLLIFSGFVFYL